MWPLYFICRRMFSFAVMKLMVLSPTGDTRHCSFRYCDRSGVDEDAISDMIRSPRVWRFIPRDDRLPFSVTYKVLQFLNACSHETKTMSQKVELAIFTLRHWNQERKKCIHFTLQEPWTFMTHSHWHTVTPTIDSHSKKVTMGVIGSRSVVKGFPTHPPIT